MEEDLVTPETEEALTTYDGIDHYELSIDDVEYLSEHEGIDGLNIGDVVTMATFSNDGGEHSFLFDRAALADVLSGAENLTDLGDGYTASRESLTSAFQEVTAEFCTPADLEFVEDYIQRGGLDPLHPEEEATVGTFCPAGM